jgi:hypothetical protein
MTDLGIGVCGFGSSIVGYGEIIPFNSTVQKLFRLPSDINLQGNAPAIDPQTGDMILDPETGINMGMDDTAQAVYLALRTLKNSSSVQDFGLDFKSKIINQTTVQKLQDAVRKALLALTTAKNIEIKSIIVTRTKQNALSCEVIWKNLSTNKSFDFNFTI